MTHHLTDLSSQRSNMKKGMQNSDHMKQIGKTSWIELFVENKSIVSEVDLTSKAGWFSKSSRVGYKSSTWSLFWVSLVPSGVGLAQQSYFHRPVY